MIVGTAVGLADAIKACLESGQHYSELSEGALGFARTIDHRAHVYRLEEILEQVATGR